MTIATMGRAVAIRAETVAVLGLVGGFLTPIILSGPGPSSSKLAVRLFAYLWVVAAGAAAASLYRRWNMLLLCSLIFSHAFLAIWLLQHRSPGLAAAILAAGTAFFLLHLAASAFLAIAGDASGSVHFAILENPCAFAILLILYSSHSAAGGVLLLMAAVFGMLTAAAARAPAPRSASASPLHAAQADPSGAAVPFLAAGVGSLILAVFLITVGVIQMSVWCGAALALLWIGIAVKFRPLRQAACVVSLVAAVDLLYGILNWVGAAVVAGPGPAAGFSPLVEIPCLLFALLAIGTATILERSPAALTHEERWMAPAAVSALCSVLFAWLTLEVLAAGGRLGSISPWLSAAWAMYAAVLFTVGVVRRRSLERLWALGVLGLVAAKVFLFDIWSLDYFFRIVSLVCLAAALWGASYLYARYRHRILSIVNR